MYPYTTWLDGWTEPVLIESSCSPVCSGRETEKIRGTEAGAPPAAAAGLRVAQPWFATANGGGWTRSWWEGWRASERAQARRVVVAAQSAYLQQLRRATTKHHSRMVKTIGHHLSSLRTWSNATSCGCIPCNGNNIMIGKLLNDLWCSSSGKKIRRKLHVCTLSLLSCNQGWISPFSKEIYWANRWLFFIGSVLVFQNLWSWVIPEKEHRGAL